MVDGGVETDDGDLRGYRREEAKGPAGGRGLAAWRAGARAGGRARGLAGGLAGCAGAGAWLAGRLAAGQTVRWLRSGLGPRGYGATGDTEGMLGAGAGAWAWRPARPVASGQRPETPGHMSI